MEVIKLYNPAGGFKLALNASPIIVKRSTSTAPAALGHLILCVDRSGSMYYDMARLRETLLKVLTLAEYTTAGLLVSLVSYSSKGDARVHFSRVNVCDLMQTGSKPRREIEGLQATALTCISGGLALAESLVQDSEKTAIVLHTDGYANDPSPYAETRALEALVAKISTRPAVFVDTVVYSSGDFSLLDMIASRCGGSCVQASSAGQVFDALNKTAATMVGAGEPAIEVKAPGRLILGYSRSAGKVISGRDAVLVRGLKATDDLELWSVDAAGKDPTPGQPASPVVGLLYARAMLAAGQLNAAKEAVLGARACDLYPHLRAVSKPQIAAFAQALEATLFGVDPIATAAAFGIAGNGPTLLDLCGLLNANLEGFEVNKPALFKGYKRRSEKRCEGEWVDGALVPSAFTTEPADDSEWTRVLGFEPNKTSATINLKMVEPARLIERSTGQVVKEVAGIKLNLSSIRALTIVSDGTITAKTLVLRVTDKSLRKSLSEGGYPISWAGNVGTIELGAIDVVPMTTVGEELLADDGIFSKLAGLKTAISILAAALKEQSSTRTADEIKALADHCLSKSLNFNPPTTTPYEPNGPGRDEFIRTGKLDSYTRYAIEIGTVELLNLDELYGANAFLERHYAVEVRGADGKMAPAKKPKMVDLWGGWSVAPKKLSGRTQLNAADALQKPYFDEFLGLTKKAALWQGLLADAGVDDDTTADLLDWPNLDSEKRVEVFEAASKALSKYNDLLFSQVLGPTVLFTGATGFLPDCIAAQAKMLTAEEMTQTFKTKIGKSGQEATYFVLPDNRVLSIRPETVWYSTDSAM